MGVTPTPEDDLDSMGAARGGGGSEVQQLYDEAGDRVWTGQPAPGPRRHQQETSGTRLCTAARQPQSARTSVCGAVWQARGLTLLQPRGTATLTTLSQKRTARSVPRKALSTGERFEQHGSRNQPNTCGRARALGWRLCKGAVASRGVLPSASAGQPVSVAPTSLQISSRLSCVEKSVCQWLSLHQTRTHTH